MTVSIYKELKCKQPNKPIKTTDIQLYSEADAILAGRFNLLWHIEWKLAKKACYAADNDHKTENINNKITCHSQVSYIFQRSVLMIATWL